MRADDQHHIDMLRELAHRALAVLRGVANILRRRADDIGEARLQRIDDCLGVVDAERRLRDIGELVRVLDLELGDILGFRDQMHDAGNAAQRAFDFGMAFMADQDNFAPLLGVALAFGMHF